MTTSLRAAALAAHEEQRNVGRKRAEERVAQRERLARQIFVHAFGIQPDNVETAGKNTLVMADGIVLRYDDELGGFNLWGTCPRCLQLDRGQYVGSLDTLGKALSESFAPNYMHHCRADYESPEPEPVPEPDPIVTALIAIATELNRIADQVEIANSCQSL